MRSRMVFAGSIVSGLFLSMAAQAAVMEYTDRSSFEAALTSKTTYTFNNIVTNGYVQLDTAISLADATIANDINKLYVSDIWGDATSAAVFGDGGEKTSGATIKITLVANKSGVGMDLVGQLPARLIVISTDGTTTQTDTFDFTPSTTFASPTFRGYTAPSGWTITRVALPNDIAGKEYPSFDNLTIGVVPEPATLGLACGAAGLLALRRRRV